jgi:hypothetical protein
MQVPEDGAWRVVVVWLADDETLGVDVVIVVFEFGVPKRAPHSTDGGADHRARD